MQVDLGLVYISFIGFDFETKICTSVIFIELPMIL